MAAAGIDPSDDYARVHRAVAAAESAGRVRRAIIDCARGSAERRVAAVNGPGENGETPLQAAHRLLRGDLVGLLLEAGADAGKLVVGRSATALALCAAYGQVGSLRALLLAGHDPNEPSQFGSEYARCCPVHVCLYPPQQCFPLPVIRPPMQLECLEVLVQEGGADVDARTSDVAYTPLHLLSQTRLQLDLSTGDDEDADAFIAGCRDQMPALELLLRLGADINARDRNGNTAVYRYALFRGDLAALRWLLEHGASPDVADNQGYTALMHACRHAWGDPRARDAALELMRRSSPETRKAVSVGGRSAIDVLVLGRLDNDDDDDDEPLAPWEKQLIAKLLAAGAPVLPEHAAVVLPIAVSLSVRQQARLDAFNAQLGSWRGHETFVGLALDARELREAQRAAERGRARLAALERELEEMGAADTTDGSSDDDDESEDGGGNDESGSDDSSSGSEEEEEEEEEEDDDGESESESEEEQRSAAAAAPDEPRAQPK